jgi:uncharacterized protein
MSRSMRRKDKEVTGSAVFTEIIASCRVGWLAVNLPDGYPRVVPVNYVWHEEQVIFHGARQGKKFDLLAGGASVSFCAAEVLSLIPAAWMGESACGTNHFYRSALVFGRGEVLTDLRDKAAALTELAHKYEPGRERYVFNPGDENDARMVEKTAVFRVVPERITVKQNLAQGEPEEVRRRLVRFLNERNEDPDGRTAQLIHEGLMETF